MKIFLKSVAWLETTCGSLLRHGALSLTGRSTALVLILAFAILSALSSSAQDTKTKEEKKAEKQEEKKPDPFKVLKLTQGMGLYTIGPLSPDKKSVLLLAHKPDSAPNLYIMNVADHSIRPPLTNLKWGVTGPQWSPDGQSIAFAGFSETATFDEIFILDLKSGKTRQLTKNSFSDKEPVFTPDGKRLLYTTDESPLPDAAFGILHIAFVPIEGGKPQAFTEDDCSSIQPGLSADRKNVLLVKVSDNSGRHSLWQYGLDGTAQRDLTETRYARVRSFITGAARGMIVLWAQEEAEQQGSIYLFDPQIGQAHELPDPDLPKKNPTLSPDGKLIAFVGLSRTGPQIFLYDSGTDQIKQLTIKASNNFSPVFVSNTEIIFGSDRERDNELYLLDLTQPFEEKEKKKK